MRKKANPKEYSLSFRIDQNMMDMVEEMMVKLSFDSLSAVCKDAIRFTYMKRFPTYTQGGRPTGAVTYAEKTVEKAAANRTAKAEMSEELIKYARHVAKYFPHGRVANIEQGAEGAYLTYKRLTGNKLVDVMEPIPIADIPVTADGTWSSSLLFRRFVLRAVVKGICWLEEGNEQKFKRSIMTGARQIVAGVDLGNMAMVDDFPPCIAQGVLEMIDEYKPDNADPEIVERLKELANIV